MRRHLGIRRGSLPRRKLLGSTLDYASLLAAADSTSAAVVLIDTSVATGAAAGAAAAPVVTSVHGEGKTSCSFGWHSRGSLYERLLLTGAAVCL